MNKQEQYPEDLMISLSVLNQMGASILSEHSIEEIVDRVYHHINQLMDAYSFAIGLYNPVSKRFEYIGARENDRKLPAFSIYAHNTERFSGWVLANRRAILINDYEKEYHLYLPKSITPLHGINPASLMYVPIYMKDDMIGILSVRTINRYAYKSHMLEILKTLAVFISKAVENSRTTPATDQPVNKPPAAYFLNPLSAREIEVLKALSQGMTNPTIADHLFISASTVKTHTLNIYKKLQATNRTEAIVKAKSFGLIK